MQKWEYNLLVQSPNTECARCEEALNGLGRDGWELVTAGLRLHRCAGSNELHVQLRSFNGCDRTVHRGAQAAPICDR